MSILSAVGNKQRRASDPPKQPWYHEGLRFECQPDCGGCCTNHDEYSYVYLENDDLEKLAAFLNLSPQAFVEGYAEVEEGYTFLKMDHPDCPFLKDKRCTVYAARPTQCRTFPFWGENLRSPARWTRLTCFCPGIDRGEKQSLALIQGHLGSRGRSA